MDLYTNTLGTPELAYLGDSVIELLVRQRLVLSGVCGAGNLNSCARKYITATAQAEAVQKILPILTEEEAGVFRRAKNHKTTNVPKSASRAQYHAATGLEALFAYLFLKNQFERINFLFDMAFDQTDDSSTEV
jgi:ribonuclease-3 family protein